jgi:MFS transporter, DHA3 family, macrolide efflux protein
MRTFMFVFAGQLVSNLGSRLTDFGLGVWIFQETRSATQFALSILVSSLPRILLAPLVGALVDRGDRRKVMIVADSVLAAKTMAILLILLCGRLSVWQIYLMNAVGSVFESFHGLAWSASIPLLVPKRHLARVNGISQMFGSANGMLAPAIAGVLFVVIGMKGIAAIDLATWAFAVAPLLLVAIPFPGKDPAVVKKTGLLREISEGWKCLRTMKGLAYLLLVYASIGFFGITTDVLHGPYVLSCNGPERYGIVESVVSVGTLAGGLLLTIVGTPRNAIWIILGSESVICLSGIVMGAVPVYWVLVSAIFLYYVMVSFCDGTIAALWQRKIPPALQGRVFALRDTLTMSLMPLGILLFSPVAEYWMEPRLLPGGQWADGLGRLIGTGPGRGIGLLFVLSGLVNAAIVAVACVNRRIRAADREIPDAVE